MIFFFQAEDGIRDLVRSRGLGDVYKRQAISRFSKQFGENGSFRLISKAEMDHPESISSEGLFSTTDDYINLTEVARKYPVIQEIAINSEEEYKELLQKLLNDQEMIPLFVKEKNGFIDIISSSTVVTPLKSFEGSKVVYLGKPMIGSLKKVEEE